MEQCVNRFRAAGHDNTIGIPLTDDEASWIVVSKGFCPASADVFDSAWAARPHDRPNGVIMGKSVSFPRRTRGYGSDYSFAGQTAAGSPMDTVPDICKMYRSALLKVIDEKPNGTLLNWYDASDGDYIGLHSDDVRSIVKDSPIFSMTWCTPNNHFRRFRLVPKTHGKTVTIEVRNGDAVVMGGTCQSSHKHEIMKTRKRMRDESNGRRINQTARYFKSE